MTLYPSQSVPLLHALEGWDAGKLRLQLGFCGAASRKARKSTIAGAVAQYFADNVPNINIEAAANSQNQASARSFQSIVWSVQNNPRLKHRVKVRKNSISFPNGSKISAIGTSAASAAGQTGFSDDTGHRAAWLGNT